MIKKFFIILFLFSLLLSCSEQQSKDILLSFDNVLINQGNKSIYSRKNGWYNPNGSITTDSLTLFNKSKSLLISPNDSTKRAEVYYYVNSEEIEGDSILFSGKYKYANANNAKIIFGINQSNIDDKVMTVTHSVEGCQNNSDWIDFEVRMALDKTNWELSFFIKTEGKIQLWVTDCMSKVDSRPLGSIIHREYDAETDKEFDNSSNIDLGVLTPQKAENLEILCKVWGFLKYYHPEVTQGKYNWDYELFRILSPIAKARDKKERDKLLNRWVDKYGKIDETVDYQITDSNKYSRIINLDWTSDKKLFDEKLIDKLHNIQKAKRNYKFNYYVVPYLRTPKEYFGRERMYENISWSDQGFRILTLFRLWNVMEYCFPYVEMTDKPWDSLVKEFIPKFLNPRNKTDYELTIMKLAANINDSHGHVEIPAPDLNNTVLSPMLYGRFPVQLMEAKGGEIVVQTTQIESLKRGDIVYSINNDNVNDIQTGIAPYIPASNNAVLTRKILSFILNTKDSLLITCIRRGVKISFTLYNEPQKVVYGIKSWRDYDLTSKNIVYIDVSMPDWYISNITKDITNAKGLIIDLRDYPIMDFSTLYSTLTPNNESFIWFSQNEKSSPGNFKYITSGKIGIERSNYFKGKVAILVNENTQSHGEFSAMAYRKAPQSITIGSTTAAADGNIAQFYLPGKILFTYTGLGAYYPEWRECQRKGVDIDIEVRPTVEEIRKGQDVWIEKAIEYILY